MRFIAITICLLAALASPIASAGMAEAHMMTCGTKAECGFTGYPQKSKQQTKTVEVPATKK